MRNKFLSVIELLRIKQWIKNVFVIFPLIFSGQLQNMALLINCVLAFFGFCLVSSSLYILNDFLDKDQDKIHPGKSNRPLTRADIDFKHILFLILSIGGLGLWACFSSDIIVFDMAVLYILLHLVYNFYTKKIVILDVVFVAAGFQIRIWAGSLAVGVVPSEWLQLCVFLLALFLGFTKRRYEISTLGKQATEHRSVLEHYTTYLLDQIIIICSTLTIVFYSLYTISPEIIERLGSHNMIYSLVFVIYGIFRYLYLLYVRKLGDDPGEVIMSDPFLLINILLWFIFIIGLLYSDTLLQKLLTPFI